MIEFTLPFPPSTNTLFANNRKKPIRANGTKQPAQRGRRITKRYAAWREEAGWELKRQRPGKASGRVDIEIELTAPDKRRRDASNYIKAIEDLAVEFGVLPDDNAASVRGVTARWGDRANRIGARVRITPAG